MTPSLILDQSKLFPVKFRSYAMNYIYVHTIQVNKLTIIVVPTSLPRRTGAGLCPAMTSWNTAKPTAADVITPRSGNDDVFRYIELKEAIGPAMDASLIDSVYAMLPYGRHVYDCMAGTKPFDSMFTIATIDKRTAILCNRMGAFVWCGVGAVIVSCIAGTVSGLLPSDGATAL